MNLTPSTNYVIQMKRLYPIIFLIALFLFTGIAFGKKCCELMTPTMVVNIRSDRSVDSKIVSKAFPGNRLKAGFLKNGWVAVFKPDDTDPDISRPMGFVDASLLTPAKLISFPVPHTSIGGENPSTILSLKDGYCRMDNQFDQKTLQRLVPRLSRIGDAHRGDLPEMIFQKTVRVLTTYSPSNYFIIRGRSYGFEYSLMKDYEHFLNHKSKRAPPRVVVEFVPVAANQLIPSLLAGLGDIIAAGMTVSNEKQKLIDFSEPYLTDIQEVVVTHRNKSQIRNIYDLSGKDFYVRPLGNYFSSLGKLNAILTADNLAPANLTRASAFLTPKDILEMINAGIIELTLMESHLVDMWLPVFPNIVALNHMALRRNAVIALGIRKNSPKLKSSLDEFLKTHKPGTLLGNIYHDQYFKSHRWIKNPLEPDELARFSKYAPLFQKYGAIYGFDWMLLAALAYQESGINPNRTSEVGAIGLMQVRPTTAQDHRIQIKNIRTPEGNIHAGVKYLALLRDSYFADAKIPLNERVRFSLAAYNAGPIKIQRCREKAALLGLDPNRWFGQTEYVAMKIVGDQPVRFVSNISKYYLAYSLSATIDCIKDQHLEKLTPSIVKDAKQDSS
jgi:membrane-bound lytic murein transglycosylase MltF